MPEKDSINKSLLIISLSIPIKISVTKYIKITEATAVIIRPL